MLSNPCGYVYGCMTYITGITPSASKFIYHKRLSSSILLSLSEKKLDNLDGLKAILIVLLALQNYLIICLTYFSV